MAASTSATEQTFQSDCSTEYASLQRYLDDAFYQKLKEHAEGIGPGSGRGRPVSLPTATTLTNCILLQLGFLRFELNKTWVWLGNFAEKIFSQNQRFGKDLPELENLINKTLAKVPSLACESNIEQFLKEERDFTYPGAEAPFCQKLGIFRKCLLDCGRDRSTSLPNIDVVPNGLIVELDKFRTENCLSGEAMFDWMQVMCPSLKDVSTKDLMNRITYMKMKYKKHLKAKARRPKELADFMQQDFASFAKVSRSEQSVLESTHTESQLSVTSSEGPSNVSSDTNSAKSKSLCGSSKRVQIPQAQEHFPEDELVNHNRYLTCRLREQGDQQQEEVHALKEVCGKQNFTINCLQKSQEKTQEELKSVQASHDQTVLKLKEVKN